MIRLENMMTSLPFAAEGFEVKDEGFSVIKKGDKVADERYVGWGQMLLEVGAIPRKKLVGVFVKEAVPHVYLGGITLQLDQGITWSCRVLIPGILEIARLGFTHNDRGVFINYFRPTMRHVFDGEWWTLDDNDVGFTIFRLSNDLEFRANFLSSRVGCA